MIQYGLVKGRVVNFGRHENVRGSKNHFHLIVEAGGKHWRCPINIKSQDGSEVWFKIENPLTAHPILNALRNLPEGLKKLPERAPGLTLDYVREPLFDRFQMIHLPLGQDGDNNDIQDHIELYARRALTETGAVAYVLGEYWENKVFESDKQFNTNSGVHDVHMNQGNDSGHRGDDGIYQDGAMLFEFPSIGWVGIFLAFNSQVWFTDEQGHRKPGFAEGPKVTDSTGTGGGTSGGTGGGTSGGGQQVRKRAAIVAALVNPVGADPGKETVTIFNASSDAVDLNGWRILDRQNKAEVLTGRTLPSNEAVTIKLSGAGAQLGNDGGTIRLFDAQGTQLDVQTYSKAQASTQGEIIVF